MGIYSLEVRDAAYIVDDAHKRGIKTVGFAVSVKDSPAVVEDTWGTATVMGYYIQNALQRQGTLVQTAEAKGFYTPFDMEADMLDSDDQVRTAHEDAALHARWRVDSATEIADGRQNALALLQAHPEPQSIDAIISWWWPFTIGAGQALAQSNRTDIRLFNHYFSDSS